MSASLKIAESRSSLVRLTTPYPTAEDLRYRAAFWRKYIAQPGIDPLDFINVEAHCEHMEHAADNPAPVVTLAPSKPVRAARKPRGEPVAAKPRPVTGEEFWRLAHQAIGAIEAVYGPHWRIKATAETFECTVPSKLRSYKSERGTVIKYRADHRFPEAKYWPGGVVPEGLAIAGPVCTPSDRTADIVEWTALAVAEQRLVDAQWRRDERARIASERAEREAAIVERQAVERVEGGRDVIIDHWRLKYDDAHRSLYRRHTRASRIADQQRMAECRRHMVAELARWRATESKIVQFPTREG